MVSGLLSTCAKSYPSVQFIFSVYGLTYVSTYDQTYTYTRLAMQSRYSVGLAQARPNYGQNIFVHGITTQLAYHFARGSFTFDTRR